MSCDPSPSHKAVYFYIHKPGPLAAITSMAISVLTAPVSVLISVALLVSILVFHASVSAIKTQTGYNVLLFFRIST